MTDSWVVLNTDWDAGSRRKTDVPAGEVVDVLAELAAERAVRHQRSYRHSRPVESPDLAQHHRLRGHDDWHTVIDEEHTPRPTRPTRSDESDATAAGTYTSVDRCDCPCGRPIGPSGPSPWFVTQECQRLWYELRTGVARQVHDPDPVTSTATPAPSRSRWMRVWDRLVRWLA